jgi:hypothetical protein
MNLDFRSAVSTTAAEPDYLGSIQLKCAAQSAVRITRASGFIGSSTGSGISFTIDPGSIATEVTGLRGLDLTGVEFNVDEVTLRWKAEVGKSYIIQHLDEFLCWKDLFFVFADETDESETILPEGNPAPKTQLYRVVEVE